MKKVWLAIGSGLALCSATAIAFYFLGARSISHLSGIYDPQEYIKFDEIAKKAGCDKASDYHNYTEIYSQHLYPFKNTDCKFLEIGIYRGDSVKAWEQYFKKADLHFLDITFENVIYKSNRSHYHLGDQASAQDIQKLIDEAGGGFDVIVDDGGHQMNQQVSSFINLFPHLKSGGLYIIEDLHTSYWPSHGGGNHPNTTIGFLKLLIDDLNFTGAFLRKASHRDLHAAYSRGLSIFQREIYSMTFYDSLVVIKKR